MGYWNMQEYSDFLGCSVPFAGLFAGPKLAGKYPTKSPEDKIQVAPKKFKLGLPNFN